MVLIVSLCATLHIMEHVVVSCVNVQWNCVMLCLGVQLPAQQVNQNVGVLFGETD